MSDPNPNHKEIKSCSYFYVIRHVLLQHIYYSSSKGLLFLEVQGVLTQAEGDHIAEGSLAVMGSEGTVPRAGRS